MIEFIKSMAIILAAIVTAFAVVYLACWVATAILYYGEELYYKFTEIIKNK